MNKFKTDYTPRSMSFISGFLGPKGDVGYTMYLSRSKAKKIILDLVLEGFKITEAYVGLDGDWEINNALFYQNGSFIDEKCFEESIWAEPIMMVHFENLPSRAYSIWNKTGK